MPRAGLSPRVRGNRLPIPVSYVERRSIPACAGEPAPHQATPSGYKVYPRVCGGTSTILADSSTRCGLSPRVRGNPHRSPSPRSAGGSIPACAGEPSASAPKASQIEVYPRVWRGNPRLRPQVPWLRGSIPACAGEPTTPAPCPCPSPVYPRVCGGTRRHQPYTTRSTGLSPRVRGNREHEPRRQLRHRSIPACAGEPGDATHRGTRQAVYPRVCGGTWTVTIDGAPQTGLSPSVRGNRPGPRPGRQTCGSIPACAGEPSTRSASSPTSTVYPRVCGGTSTSISTPLTGTGLSPRVRGNLTHSPHVQR